MALGKGVAGFLILQQVPCESKDMKCFSDPSSRQEPYERLSDYLLS